MTTETPTALPDKPSELIELALADLEKAEKTPEIKVDMSAWLWQRQQECLACFAGCVMRFSLGAKPDIGGEALPSHFGDLTKGKLRSLENFRSGFLKGALHDFFGDIDYLRAELAGLPDSIEVRDYEDDPGEFKHDMRSIAVMLKEKGL